MKLFLLFLNIIILACQICIDNYLRIYAQKLEQDTFQRISRPESKYPYRLSVLRVLVNLFKVVYNGAIQDRDKVAPQNFNLKKFLYFPTFYHQSPKFIPIFILIFTHFLPFLIPFFILIFPPFFTIFFSPKNSSFIGIRS